MESNTTYTTTSLSNEESISAQYLSREEFLQTLKTNNDSFKSEIEVLFKSKVSKQLQINNLAIKETFNKKFSAF